MHIINSCYYFHISQNGAKHSTKPNQTQHSGVFREKYNSCDRASCVKLLSVASLPQFPQCSWRRPLSPLSPSWPGAAPSWAARSLPTHTGPFLLPKAISILRGSSLTPCPPACLRPLPGVGVAEAVPGIVRLPYATPRSAYSIKIAV